MHEKLQERDILEYSYMPLDNGALAYRVSFNEKGAVRAVWYFPVSDYPFETTEVWVDESLDDLGTSKQA
jgi:hypothetical protein